MNGELLFAIWYGIPTLLTGICAYLLIKKDYINALKNESNTKNILQEE